MADKVVRLVVGMVVNVWMVRYLGAGQLGVLSFTQSVIAILAILSQLGLDGILVRDLVRRPGDSGVLLGSALALRLTGAGLTIGLSMLVLGLLRPGNPTIAAMGLVFGSIYTFQALDVIDGWFQSRTRVAPVVVARFVAFALATAAKIAALLSRAPLTWIAVTIAVEFVFAALGLVVAYRLRSGERSPWRFDPVVARQLLMSSWPLMLNGAATLLLIRIDQAMLTLMRGEHENGIYAAAQRLTEIVFFVPLAISNAATPALLRSHARGSVEYGKRLGRYFALLTWAALAVAVPVSLLAGPITTTLFGAGFRDSGPVLALHIWSLPGFFMGVAITNWFVAEDRPAELMLRSVFGATLNVALNLWLIPAYGARGAAIATLVAQTAAYWLVNAAFPRTRELFRLQCRGLWPGTLRPVP
jgi:PST family polysaccharide transporter